MKILFCCSFENKLVALRAWCDTSTSFFFSCAFFVFWLENIGVHRKYKPSRPLPIRPWTDSHEELQYIHKGKEWRDSISLNPLLYFSAQLHKPWHIFIFAARLSQLSSVPISKSVGCVKPTNKRYWPYCKGYEQSHMWITLDCLLHLAGVCFDAGYITGF